MTKSYALLFLLNLSFHSRASGKKLDVPKTLHRIVNNKVIRDALDSFTMVRRDTYTHTPEFGQSVGNLEHDLMRIVHNNDITTGTALTYYTDTTVKLKKEYLQRMSNRNSETKMNTGFNDFKIQVPPAYTSTPENFKNNNDNKVFGVNIRGKDAKTLFNDIIVNEEKLRTNRQNSMQKVNDFDEQLLPEINEFSNDQQLKDRKDQNSKLLKKHLKEGNSAHAKYLPEISRVLKKQNDLIEALRQATDANSEDEHFLDIMESIDKKKRTKARTTMVMIDQIDVRQALYNDPLVRRILKLGQRKNKQNNAYFQLFFC